eukprot:scaffold149168_cov33-Tisochrysis_lutea.AAC.1
MLRPRLRGALLRLAIVASLSVLCVCERCAPPADNHADAQDIHLNHDEEDCRVCRVSLGWARSASPTPSASRPGLWSLRTESTRGRRTLLSFLLCSPCPPSALPGSRPLPSSLPL